MHALRQACLLTKTMITAHGDASPHVQVLVGKFLHLTLNQTLARTKGSK